ncbi:MAG: NAD-dependent epimerase/dehydratase family protein [Deltaproteobacteria bacterium]|nr:NAD-dependent epimerase/dehydratase family protein [Deltaproteobacteria bacterium]MBW2384047.1 NAD-dependent epimerase/dehydratase family protein [Deltaproteobacteria bacterium]MBW2697468.1 NAD-dependent epimerase/dehydratase family protein [Deltaproteobacteria bacterium]
MKKVLITGVAGALGRLLAARLSDGVEVCGVDVVPWRGPGLGVRMHRVDLRKRRFEDVVRTERPDAVVHMGFVRHFDVGERERHDVNVRGTKQLLDHCVKYAVQQLVVVSSSAVYGAFAENPYAVGEDFPLSASRSYPEIRDQVEVDTLASGFLWQHPEVHTSVLRPVNVLGPTMRSMMATYLRLPRVPTVAGYDPMMQVIAEADMTESLVLALQKKLRGVYNVVGSGEVPLHTAIRESGGVSWPIPMPFARMICQRFFEWGVWSFPPGLVDYLRFPVSVSGKPFAEATGFEPRVSLREIFASMRDAR